MSVRLTFYDGAGCIGGNKILLEADDTALFFDFGTNFGAEGRFFDEFLRPRPARGVCDLLDLGLLPPLEGIYRADLDLPDRAWWERLRARPLYRELRVDGLLLSHAHFDHTGYISYLDHNTPIVTGLATAVIAKAMQDTQHGGTNEVCYITPKEAKEGLLQSVHHKTGTHQQRPFVLLDGQSCGERFESFWSQGGTSRAMGVRRPECRGAGGEARGEARVGNLPVRRYPVDHSIPGAGAFAVKTSEGWVVYTGDLRLHGGRADETRAFMRAAADLEPLALICEGTHPGKEEPVYEKDVYANAAEAVDRAEGLVIADFGPRNVERLLTFHRIARETGRRLAITTKDAYLLGALHDAGVEGAPNLRTDGTFAVYVEAKLRYDAWERNLVENYLTSAPDRVIRADAVGKAPGEYICCFSYYDLHELIDIQPAKGMYIYSSSEAFNEEMQIDMDRLRAWIAHFNLRFVGEPPSRDGRGGQPGLHASGHIHGPGLIELVEAIRPQVLIGIHTESQAWFRQHFLGKVPLILPAPGETVVLPSAGAATAAWPAG